jgi:hypothetical protein
MEVPLRKRLLGLLVGALALGAEGGEMTARDGSRDFDFWMGPWRVHNRRLRERLKGGSTWDEFEASVIARPLLGGAGNEDVYRTAFAGGFTGMSFRFYDKATGRWSIHWADSRKGTLDPPVIGGFSGDVGLFLGDDTLEGRPIRVRFTWSGVTTQTPRWEQAFSADGGLTWETNWVLQMSRPQAATDRELPVVELRRYVVKPGERERFARRFEGWFPEAFQQLGAVIQGQFLERSDATRFTWLRGFPSYEARAELNGEFYSGWLWKEHAAEMNAMMSAVDDVLLLRPLADGRGVALLPAVDPARAEGAARGVVAAQLFPVKPGQLEAFARLAEPTFARYRAAGAREAGVLATLEAPNNFPRLPVRADGPYLVWLGVLEDEAALARFTPNVGASLASLAAAGLLRREPELLILDPTQRSRLRWLPEWRE